MSREIRFAALPTALFGDLVAHLEALVRELTRLRDPMRAVTADVPAEPAQAIEGLAELYRAGLEHAARLASEAARGGQHQTDLVVRVGSTTAPTLLRFVELLEEADEWSRSGALATSPAKPEIVRLRRWLAQEVALQINGAPPWPYRSAER